ncbi:immunity protein Imm33 domain-containing protein [Nocardioides sp. P5_C9_2]
MGTVDEGRGRRVDYRLAGAAALAEATARVFVVPRPAERRGVLPGDLVEVLCEIVDPVEGMPGVERLWVRVSRARGTELHGVVDAEPRFITTVGPGDEIAFGPEHVVATHDLSAARTAVVSRRAHVEDTRPRFVYRQPPMSPSDSGFSVMVGDESQAELDDPGALTSHALGVLLARWPELGPVFASRSVEGEWIWDESTRRYVPRPSPR